VTEECIHCARVTERQTRNPLEIRRTVFPAVRALVLKVPHP
jgi:hypothetical protein